VQLHAAFALAQNQWEPLLKAPLTKRGQVPSETAPAQQARFLENVLAIAVLIVLLFAPDSQHFRGPILAMAALSFVY
jgi:hypothetical protein